MGYPYITVGNSVPFHRVTGITADMSWLGDPPTDEQSARYERVRAVRIVAAITCEISVLASEERQLMYDVSACESPVRRQKLTDRLREVIGQIAKLKADLEREPEDVRAA